MFIINLHNQKCGKQKAILVGYPGKLNREGLSVSKISYPSHFMDAGELLFSNNSCQDSVQQADFAAYAKVLG